MSKRSEYENRTETLIAPILEEYGCKLYDVEYVKEGSDYYLRVYIDKPGGVTIDDCVNVSRAMNEILDREDYIADAYTFEVSSPGVERVLRKPWHFQEVMGKEITIRLYKSLDGTKDIAGTLTACDEQALTIHTDAQDLTIPHADIAIARLAYED